MPAILTDKSQLLLYPTSCIISEGNPLCFVLTSSDDDLRFHACSVKYLFRAHKTKRKEKIIIQKVFYGHRLTQINADGNHKLLIIFGGHYIC